MNKNDLITFVAEKAGLTKSDSAKAIDAFIAAVEKALKSGGDLRLVGFGTFYTSKRAASVGRNPQTGQKINIPAATVPKFKAGKKLKDVVN